MKDKFEKSLRMDIGYAQKMKFTRWAFVKFANVDDAIEAYKMTVNSMMDDRSLIVRFRRSKNKNSNGNLNEKCTPKMNENECKSRKVEPSLPVTATTTTTTTTMMTTSLVEKDTNENDNEVNVLNDKKECNTPIRNEVISKEQSIANDVDDDDDDFYDDDDDDELPSNILTALPSSKVLQEPSKSKTCSSSIAPPSPLMQEEDAIFEPPMRADNIIMDTPSPSLPSHTPTQDEGTPNHLTEHFLLPSLLLQDVDDDDDDEDDEVSNGNINPPNKENSSCDVAYNMPLLDTPQSSLSIHDESLSFDTPLLLRGTQPEDDDNDDNDPPPKEMPFKQNIKKTQTKSTMQDSCDITCFFSLDSTRVPALLEAETSDEVMARLSNEATPLPSPLFLEDDDIDYQVYQKTLHKSRSNRSTISCSLGHLQSKDDNLCAHLSASGSKSSLSSAEKDYQILITPPKERSPAIKTGSDRKNFTLENGFNCYDWSFSEDGEFFGTFFCV